MEVQKYRVKPGAELAHAGLVLTGGTDLELAPHVAYEVRHLVDPVEPLTGAVMPWVPVDQAQLELELAKARPHERISLIEDALKANTADGDRLRALLAAENKANEQAAKALEKKAEAKVSSKPAPGPQA